MCPDTKRRCGHLVFINGAIALITLIILLMTSDKHSEILRAHSLTLNATSALGHLTDFRYTINSNKCGDDPVFVLLQVGSHPNNRAIRDVIRKTWGDPGLDRLTIKLIFPFGQLTDPDKQKELEAESDLWGDIIQGNFIDSYRNLTTRDLMALRWSWQRCHQANFVAHVDGDMAMDVYGLVHHLRQDFRNQSANDPLIACVEVWIDALVRRYGKYNLTTSEYQSDRFNPYCLGWLYVMTPGMARLLDEAALMAPPYWLNDAYITGTLVRLVGRGHRKLRLQYAWYANGMRGIGDRWNASSGYPPTYNLGPHGNDTKLMLVLHHKFKQYASRLGILH